jgi:hypothetical protein
MFEEEYDNYDSIPSAVRHLYRQVGEKWCIISAGEIKTSEDVTRVQEGLRKEREDHKATKRKLAQFNDMDPDEVLEKLDRIEELEAAAAGKIDESKINEMVETRIKSKTAPLERHIQKLTQEKGELESQVGEFQGKERRRTIHDHIRKAATAAKIRDTAVDDALLVGENVFEVDESGRVVTKDGVGVTPGVEAAVWLTEVRQTRPHWWPESHGVGARGGDGGNGSGANPFTKENWNLTEQGRLIKQDRARAEQMAKSAGTNIGGPRPEK